LSRRANTSEKLKKDAWRRLTEQRLSPKKGWPEGFDTSALRACEVNMDPAYYTWSKTRRVQAAVDKAVHSGWTVVEAAAVYGVERANVQRRTKEERDRLTAKQAEEGPADKTFVPEDLTRVMPPFEEWERKYFSHVVCPDCGVNHEMAPFQHEIINLCEDTEQKRVMVTIPPNHAKSSLVTIKWVVYNICRNPNIKILIISETESLGKEFLQSIKQILSNDEFYQDGPNLIKDYGPFFSPSSTWTDTAIRVANRRTMEKDATVQVIGMGSQIRSRRPNIIIGDDVVSVKSSNTSDQVQKSLRWWSREVTNRTKGEPGIMSGKIIILGSRAAPEDFYAKLSELPAYKIVKYPAIKDDSLQQVLWPEHFNYQALQLARGEMLPGDFELVFQQVDIPGTGQSFPIELLDSAKDVERVVGQHDRKWRIVAGLDPAGGGAHAGFTAIVVMGIDVETGNRYLIDILNEQSFRAPQLKEAIFTLTEMYGISAWKVEGNGLQSQLVQYNDEIVRPLAAQGVRIQPHTTNSNKWDKEFGVESTAVLFHQGMISIPWGSAPSAQKLQPLIEQLTGFPHMEVSDLAMAFWMAELACRDYVRRPGLQGFQNRIWKRSPSYVKNRTVRLDLTTEQVLDYDPTDPVLRTPPGLFGGTRTLSSKNRLRHQAYTESVPINVRRGE